jgi:hypothetical protein
MKKILFVLILTILSQFAFSQSEVMKFLSMGFNVRVPSRGDASYFFYGYEDYSEALFINDNIELSTSIPGTFYPQGYVCHGFSPYDYRRYNGQNNSIGYEHDVPASGTYGEEYRFENGKLVYWASGGARVPTSIAEKIEQDNQSITISFSFIYSEGIFQYKYYNIPRTELLDLFLKKYVELIVDIDDLLTGKIESSRLEERFNDYFFSEFVSALLGGRTSRELAIFRNCLYAIKGNKFTSSAWTDFFNKYLNNYKAQFSNAEVTAMLTDNEKRLLDLIMQYENRR